MIKSCKNCKWLYEPEWSSVCVNGESDNCCNFVLPNDSCDQFEIKPFYLKTGEEWGNV